MDRQRFLIPMLALITVWRIALLPTAELCPDEALALLLSKHSSLWHLEMGPLVPWLVKFSTLIGGTTELGVRWMAPLLAFAMSVMLWRLCCGIFGATTAAWTLVALQVLPVFNVASLVMTSAIVGTTLVLAFVLSFRMALHRARPWDRMWWITGGLLTLAMLADWRNGLAWFCAALSLAGSSRRRHHLFSPGFAIITAGMLVPLVLFITWNVQQDWPSLEAGEWEPIWKVWPNALRWLLLASPLLAVMLLWSMRTAWRERRRLAYDEALLLAFAIPFAVFDFAWGPRERWPQTGFSLWMLLGLGMLAHQNISLAISVQRKVMLRSGALLLAAIQSLVLMRTDFVRSMGVPWPLSTAINDTSHLYSRWLKADPASSLMGWRQGASVLEQMLADTAKPSEQPWFIVAPHWQLAATIDAYLSPEAKVFQPTPEHPRIQVVESTRRDHPLALLPRYDATLSAETSFAKHNAIYVSDDAFTSTPPTSIRRAFDHWEILSVVRVMHAGAEVRTLKIFACYGYQPPDL